MFDPKHIQAQDDADLPIEVPALVVSTVNDLAGDEYGYEAAMPFLNHGLSHGWSDDGRVLS